MGNVTPVPDDHTRVRWVFNRDKTVQGTVVDMPTRQARDLRVENRVAWVDPATPLTTDVQAAAAPAPTVAPGQAAPAPAPVVDAAPVDEDDDQADAGEQLGEPGPQQ